MSSLKNFDLIKRMETTVKTRAIVVPIINISESEVMWYKGPALNEIASARPRIITLNTQLPRISP